MSTAAIEHQLRALLIRPLEPLFYKGGDRKLVFALPNKNFLSTEYFSFADHVLSGTDKTDANVVVLKELPETPDIAIVLQVPRIGHFSLFIPYHRKSASQLVDLFLDAPDAETLMSRAAYCRDKVNPMLFNYALTVAVLHRSDIQSPLPSLVQTFPDKFLDGPVLSMARETAHTLTKASLPYAITMDYTATDLEPEHRVAYFREDLGVNLHHWHWHLVYPHHGSKKVVDKDRRGELFYYMHRQLVARYNFERLSNKLPRVKRFIDWYEPIEEGYFPHLTDKVAGQNWPARTAKSRLRNLDRENDQTIFDIQDLERWRNRIYDAIHSGIVITNKGETKYLNETEGIDILGNIVESSDLSVNGEFYGDIHNMLHVFISLVHDPDNRNLENIGVMGNNATAVRDPAFFRLHAFIDDVFQEHKKRLKPYTDDELTYPDIIIDNISVATTHEQENGTRWYSLSSNQFHTFWQLNNIDIAGGLDFSPHMEKLLVRIAHLQHDPFEYYIQVTNKSGEKKKGTCRIFLSPKYNEQEKEWMFNEQRLMMIELDRFVVRLNPGQNKIIQKSSKSNVTIPFDRIFNMGYKPEDAEWRYCGCGWPDYMLIPKGKASGMECQLFVMISDYEKDKVVQDNGDVCDDSSSYCGLFDKKYPDKRAMGYPFDRVGNDKKKLKNEKFITLSDFLTPNMKVQDVTIKFTDETNPWKQTDI